MSPVKHSPPPGRTTPIIEDTPSPATLKDRSDTAIPESPLTETTTPQQLKPTLTPNLTNLLILLSDAISNVGNVKTSGANLTLVGGAKTALEEAKTITQTLLKAEEEERQQMMEQISKDLIEIKKQLAKPTITTYAQAVESEPTKEPPSTPASPTEDKNSDTKIKRIKKQKRDKFTIVLSAVAAPDATKNQLKAMHAKELIQKCQNAIMEEFKEGHIPKIHGINNIPENEYRLHCESEKDPLLLNEMDWNSVFTGVTTRRRKYGLVIHGVPKKDVEFTIPEDEAITREEIEEENSTSDKTLQIAQIIPLRRTQKHLNKITAHHSIVCFTHNIEEADRCLQGGMSIKGRYYYPEKYTPDLNVTQCYKCYLFGHLAKHCKEKQKCCKCGSVEHEAANCTNPTKCIGCGKLGKEAWHKDCEKRDKEGEKLKKLKQETLDRYSV